MSPITSNSSRSAHPYFNKVIALLVVLVIAVTGTWLLLSTHAAYVSPTTKLSAVYMGGDPSKMPSFENWRSRPVDKTMIFPSGKTWSDIQNVVGSYGWSSTAYKDKMIMAIKMLPCAGTTPDQANLQAGAAGSYDAYWTAAAQKLVSYGEGNAIIRTGWEFNQDNACFTINPASPNARPGASAANYAAYYRNIVNAMRKASGQHFTFVWNPANGNQGVDATTAYPGDGYVDYIGLDSYDTLYGQDCSASTFTTRWDNIVNNSKSKTNPQGLTFWDNYAKSHGKPLAFAEWGLWGPGLPYCGGADDPQYIQAMHDWIGAHNVYYESYFDSNSSDGVSHYLGPNATNYPNAAAKYVELFKTPFVGTVPSAADTTRPTVSITAPASSQTVSGTSLPVSGTAQDNIGIASVSLRVDNAFIASDNAAPYTFTLNTTQFTNGTHTLALRAWDAANNYTDTSVSINVQNSSDTTAPSVGIVVPSNGSTVKGLTPVQASATDNTTVSKVEFYLDGSLTTSDSTAPYCLAGDNGSTCNAWDSKAVADGPHTLVAKAYDGAGNNSSNGVTISVANTVATTNDTTAPVASIKAPANGSRVSGKVNVSASATDNVAVTWLEIRVDNVVQAAGATDSLTYSWNTNPKGVANGNHTITVTAKDAAGNVGTTSITVTK